MTNTPLSQRMIEAAETLEEFNQVYSDMYTPDATWRPSELRREAEHRETEEREAAEREAVIAQLASDIFETVFDGKLQDAAPASQVFYRDVARHLVDAGWRKDGDA